MALLLDTGVVYAYYDRDDRWHGPSVDLLTSERGRLLLPTPVVPEVDHLLGVRLGAAARRRFYRGLVETSYLLVELAQEQLPRLVEIEERFADLDLGFADCAVATLAEALGVPRVATIDRRHFEPLARAVGLELLPGE